MGKRPKRPDPGPVALHKDLVHGQELGRMTEDRDRWRQLAYALYGHLDNIDTMSDAFKGAHAELAELEGGLKYLEGVERFTNKRHLYLETDGYIVWPKWEPRPANAVEEEIDPGPPMEETEEPESVAAE